MIDAIYRWIIYRFKLRKPAIRYAKARMREGRRR